MKHLFNCLLLVALMSLLSSKTLAYDIAVKNGEGVTIYYNYINDGSELEVTYKGEDYYGFHTGYLELESIAIPSQVVVSGKVYQVTCIGNEAFGGWGRSSSVPYKIRNVSIPISVAPLVESLSEKNYIT